MKTFSEICFDRAEKAPLDSDDHGHDTTALREFCERELIYAYDSMVPELCRRLDLACLALKQLDPTGYEDLLKPDLEGIP